MSKEAMKLALEALETSMYPQQKQLQAITALREALAEQPAQQDSTCSNALRAQGKAYPRTCKKCGLGLCVELAQQALDKKAENARELGLDYEPAQKEPVAFLVDDDLYYPEEIDWESLKEQGHTVAPLYTSPPAQPMHPEIKKMYEDYFDKCFRESSIAERTWVGLTDEELSEVYNQADWDTVNGWEYERAIEAKLKEMNT